MRVVGALSSALVQLVHLLPPLVGLVLVARMRTAQRWRTWGLWFFGLSLLGGLVSLGVAGGLAWRGPEVFGGSPAGLYAVSGLSGVLALAAAGFGVAAVVADRSESTSTPGG